MVLVVNSVVVSAVVVTAAAGRGGCPTRRSVLTTISCRFDFFPSTSESGPFAWTPVFC